MTEQQLQAECFQWHWNTFPEHRQTLWHNDNNSGDSRTGNMKKAQGVVKGVSDFTLALPNFIFFVELKILTGALKEEQKMFAKKMTALGHGYIKITSLQQFQDFINSCYGK